MHLTKLKWTAALVLGTLALTAGACWAVPSALAAVEQAQKAQAELKKLEGTWRITSAEKAGQARAAKGDEESIKIEGDRFSIWHEDKAEESGKFTLDPSKTPMRVDFEFLDGKHAGTTDRAIYAWEGANLKICWEAGAAQPPGDFSTKEGDMRVMLVLKKDAP